MTRRSFLVTTAAGALAAPAALRAAPAAPAATAAGAQFVTDVPATRGNVLLARPTGSSVTLNVLLTFDAQARVAFGGQGHGRRTTEAIGFKAGDPREVVLAGLTPDAAHGYELVDAADGRLLLPEGGGGAGAFRTARPPGAEFTFTVQADSHLDEGCRADVYRAALGNQLADRPDFLIDLGDTSMTGKHPSRESALRQYLAQRHYFGLVGHSVPSFLVIGNHDGEEAKRPGATAADGLAVWACRQRKRLFSNPEPRAPGCDGFYSGNDVPHEHAGMLQDYYAWTWGDALFVVLDPYWTSSTSRGGSGGWNLSLGKRQHDWLAATLRSSRAAHKLVFIHQLTGGLDAAGRGGAEAAGLYEWGGLERGGRDAFADHRAGWSMPTHRLLVEAGVRAVFHGHDHFYAAQQKDGVLYLLAPQAARRNFRGDHAAEYGYREGRFLPSSGHLRVTVSPEQVRIDYVRAVPDALARAGLRNRDVAATITARAAPARREVD